MNGIKFAALVALALTLAITLPASAIRIKAPDDLQRGSFHIASPDDMVRTLGKVSFILDLAAEHDTLFELKIRRSGLKLADGRPMKVFGYDKAAGLIVVAAGPVRHLSIAGTQSDDKGRQASVLFHGDGNEIIAPDAGDIAVFDLDFKPVAFSYRPMVRPAVRAMPVNVLIDSSGSMNHVMPDVVKATKTFLAGLPDFTRCQIFTFSSTVKELTPGRADSLASCPDSGVYVGDKLETGGTTALYEALRSGFEGNSAHAASRPPLKSAALTKLVIAVTDGVNTASTELDKERLRELKAKHRAKLFVFWAGNHDPDHLNGLSDWEVVSTSELHTELSDFFNAIGVSVSGIQTLFLPTP